MILCQGYAYLAQGYTKLQVQADGTVFSLKYRPVHLLAFPEIARFVLQIVHLAFTPCMTQLLFHGAEQTFSNETKSNEHTFSNLTQSRGADVKRELRYAKSRKNTLLESPRIEVSAD